MPDGTTRQAQLSRAAVVAGSLLAHVAVLALLGMVQPSLREVFRSDPDVVELELWRPYPSAQSSHRSRSRPTAPDPIQPRRVAADAPAAPIAPLPVAPAAAGPAGAAGGAGGSGLHPAPWPAEDRGALKRALRGSTVGCANRNAVGLTRREREACDDRGGAGAGQAAFIEPPMDPDKRRAWDAAAARKALARRRKEGAVPPGVNPGDNAGGTRTNGIRILGE